MKTLHTIYNNFAKRNLARLLTIFIILFTLSIVHANATKVTDKVYTFGSSSTPTGWSVGSSNAHASGYLKLSANDYLEMTVEDIFAEGEILSSNTIKVEVSCGTFGTWSNPKSVSCSVELRTSNGEVLTTNNATFSNLNNSESTYRTAIEVNKPNDPAKIAYLRITFSNFNSTSSGTLRVKNVRLNYETSTAAPCDNKVTIEKGTESNGTFTLDNVGEQETCDGLTITVTPNADDHYSVASVTATTPTTGEDPIVTDNGNGTWSVVYAENSTGNSTINVTFAEDPKATITLSEAGATTSVTGNYVGDQYTLPSSDATCDDKEFVGWSTEQISTATDNPTATIYEAGASVTLAENNDFYAVFATKGEPEGTTSENVTRTYTFSSYSQGTQYASNEEHILDDDVTIWTTNCHFTTQLRIYSNGYVISNELPGRIVSIGMNAGNKADNVLIYGSTDGESWTEVGYITTQTTYKDYTLAFGDNTTYTYFKLDVEGSN